jgi:hypothetical protein
MEIVSIDAGNGFVDGVMNGKRNHYTYARFPSVRALATGDSLGLGSGFEMSFNFVDWGSHRYLFGDEALLGMRKAIERHQGAGRYGDEFHQFLVAVAIGMMDVKEGDIDLTLFAPPGLYAKAAPIIQKRFSEAGGAGLRFAKDDKVRKWRYKRIRVQPEGVGAAACFMLNADGVLVDASVLAGDVLVIDIGMHTLDVLQMKNGNFNPESLSTATWENGGLKAHVLEPVLRQVIKVNADFSLMTLDDIDLVLRRGILSDNWILESGGKTIDLRETFAKRFQRYAEWVKNNVLDGAYNGLRGLRGGIPVGGGASLVQSHLENYYPEKIMRFGEGTTKGIDPIDANAIGGLRMAKFALSMK